MVDEMGSNPYNRGGRLEQVEAFIEEDRGFRCGEGVFGDDIRELVERFERVF